MKYISSRGGVEAVSASEALQKGLAADGGLFIPQSWPTQKLFFDQGLRTTKDWMNLSYAQVASVILKAFFNEDPLMDSLDGICTEAFNFPLPLKILDQHTALLELFHGPTHAFKDFGARFLALTLQAIRKNKKHQKEALVLVATSGDTGGAVAAAFSECTQIPVVILFPYNKISKRQEKQLTSWPKGVRAFAVKGDFDQCQKLVKEAFLAEDWNSDWDLISANSINLGRLLPQMTYFVFASLNYINQTGREPCFVVPSGNLGNSVAALGALKMGFPIQKVICAHNANQAVPDYFTYRVWNPKPTIATLANAMDVGNPSNFERMKGLFAGNELFEKVQAISVSDPEIQSLITSTQKKYGEIICPHTATAFAVRQKLISEDLILVATAHPAKFEEIDEPLLHLQVPIPENLARILDQESKIQIIDPRLEALKDALKR